MKKWILFQVVLVIMTLCVGLFCMSKTTDCGIKSVKTVEDFFALEPTVKEFAQGGEKLASSKKKMFSRIEEDSMLYHTKRNVIIVKAAHSLKQHCGTLVQQVKVEKVLEGDKEITNNQVDLVLTGGLQATNQGAEMIPIMGKNILMPENRYLVFCEKSEISDYLDTPMYRVNISSLSYLNLDSNQTILLDDVKDDNLKNYKDSEFFIKDKETNQVMYQIKEEVLKQFGLK